MNTYLHIVIQFSDMSEPENNCSVLTVATKCEVLDKLQNLHECIETYFLCCAVERTVSNMLEYN